MVYYVIGRLCEADVLFIITEVINPVPSGSYIFKESMDSIISLTKPTCIAPGVFYLYFYKDKNKDKGGLLKKCYIN